MFRPGHWGSFAVLSMISTVVRLACLFLVCVVSASAQSEFDKAKLVFSNGKTMIVELADTPDSQRRGLAGRMHLGENQGMLFLFPAERRMSFWMKDTYIPLSIAFFDKDKKLMSIEKMEPQSLMAKQYKLKQYASERPGLYALEANQGWFEKNGVAPGTTFELNKLE